MSLGPNVQPFENAPEEDRDWSDEDWQRLLDWLIESGKVSIGEVAALTLGHLNPPQVGTSIASNKSFQSQYPPRKTMQAVYAWFKALTGHCADCDTRLELQADHIVPKQSFGDHPEKADTLDNVTLRCRRCNVVKRPSHKKGGLTFLTAESALMWLLFSKQPRTYQGYEELCRAYGLTMANIRFHESWAMAHWLAREDMYEIDDDSVF